MRNHVWGLGAIVVCALAAAACSGGPDNGERGSSPQVDVGKTSEAFTHWFGPAGQTLHNCPDANSKEFPACNLLHADGTFEEQAQPTFVLRIYDTDGQLYGFNDNHSLPFPTAWVSGLDADRFIPGSTVEMGLGCNPDPRANGFSDCVFEKKVAAFEKALNPLISVNHQFLVYELTPAIPKGASQATDEVVGTEQFFYNGTQDTTKFDAMKNLIVGSTYEHDGEVDAKVRKCVYVFQQNPNGACVYTGYHADVAQSHDPISWPD